MSKEYDKLRKTTFGSMIDTSQLHTTYTRLPTREDKIGFFGQLQDLSFKNSKRKKLTLKKATISGASQIHIDMEE